MGIAAFICKDNGLYPILVGDIGIACQGAQRIARENQLVSIAGIFHYIAIRIEFKFIIILTDNGYLLDMDDFLLMAKAETKSML